MYLHYDSDKATNSLQHSPPPHGSCSESRACHRFVRGTKSSGDKVTLFTGLQNESESWLGLESSCLFIVNSSFYLSLIRIFFASSFNIICTMKLKKLNVFIFLVDI